MSTFGYVLDRDTEIIFPAKPSESIRSMLKCAGFRWSPSGGCWWRRGVRGAADFLAALERRIDHEAGIIRPDGRCWDCHSPDGFFRPYGAAAPVLCADCHAKRKAGIRHGPNGPGNFTDREPVQPDATDLAFEDACREACGL